jgi:hypothetical protein
MSLQEALLIPSRGYRRRGLTALARAAGLRRQTLSYRLKIGLPLAVTRMPAASANTVLPPCRTP